MEKSPISVLRLIAILYEIRDGFATLKHDYVVFKNVIVKISKKLAACITNGEKKEKVQPESKAETIVESKVEIQKELDSETQKKLHSAIQTQNQDETGSP